MVTTKHCQARMAQRGLPKRLLDLVLELGKVQDQKIILVIYVVYKQVLDKS